MKKESLEAWQLLSDRLRDLEEEKKRYQQQIQYITENTAAAINEKIQVTEELMHRTRELEALALLAQALIQLREPSKVMEMAVQKAPQVLGVDSAGIYLWDEKRQELSLTHSHGVSSDMAPHVASRRLGQGLVGMVAKTKQPLYTADAGAVSPIGSEPTQVPGVRGFASVPIVSNQRLLGVLAVGSPHTWDCTPHHIEVLTTLGNLIAATLQNASLYQETWRQAKRIETISKLSSIISSSLNLGEVYETFSRTLKQVISVDWAVVTLIDETQQKLRFIALSSQIGSAWDLGQEIPLEGTATAWVAANRAVSYEPDLEKERLFRTDEAILKQGIRTIIRLPLVFKNRVIGSLCLGSRQPQAYTQEDTDMLTELANQIAVAVSNDLMFEGVSRHERELEAAFSESLRVWIQSWEGRYAHIKGHSDKVAQYSRKTAQQMGIADSQVRNIEMAARLHDIGLVTIPDEVMLRVGKLSPEDKAMVEQHPQAGADMLRFSPVFADVAPLIHAHHERHDGRGYPRGLKGQEIPLGARIIGVAEGYAITGMHMPFRPAFTPEQTHDYMASGCGTRYDPDVLEAFFKVIRT
ncbi:MAG: GAF domain-containing protein [Chloroflexi bacterium]|nr:GAF domain-containing protein [Chloroflexota bacterium]